MTRTTRNITIGLVGSVLMATCCLTSGCMETEEERQQRLAEDRRRGVVTHRHGRWWPRMFWWGSPGYSRSSPSFAPHSHSTGGGKSAGSSHSSGSTSRGGFGSSGHSHSGG